MLKCGYCNYTDSEGKMSESHIGTSCLICGASVPCRSIYDSPKICDQCKAAVMAVREHIEHARNGGVCLD